jgi:transposase InsO family protein
MKKKSKTTKNASEDRIAQAFILRIQRKWKMEMIATHFGVSRRTIQRWLNLYADEKSRYWNPARHCRKKKKRYGRKVRERVAELRMDVQERPASSIHRMLKNELKGNCPSVQTVRRILREAGLSRGKPRRKKNYIKYERDFPNELWQIDFKGWSFFKNLGKLHLLAILDDRSRFIVAARWYRSSEERHVIDLLRQAFLDHGLPNEVLSDNGSQFKTIKGENSTRYYKLLALLGVKPIYHAPHHPETKGKLERWFGTVQSNFVPEARLRVEKQPSIKLDQYNRLFDRWLEWYNHEHSHSSLDGQAPAKVYLEHPKRIERALQVDMDWDQWESTWKTRKVTKQGIISFEGKKYVLPSGHAGQKVDVRVLENALEAYEGGTLVETFQLASSSTPGSPWVERKVAMAGTFKYKRCRYYVGYKNAHKIVRIIEATNGQDLLVYNDGILLTRIEKSQGTKY